MSLETDRSIDRHRLTRQLRRWRLIAVVLLVALGLSFVLTGEDFSQNHVARFDIVNIIVDDIERDRVLEDIAEDDSAKALIVRIDSPGGTVVGGEALYHKLRTVAARKPVVAVIGEMGTSGAYMAAIGSDRIFARRGSITGSIGVIWQTADISGLLEHLGITTEAIKSAPLKGEPSPLTPMTPAVRKATESLVNDTYRLFVAMVAERRALGPEELQIVGNGQVFTGAQALDHGLIDAIGGIEEARAWLAATHDIPASLPLRLWNPARDRFWRALDGVLGGKVMFSERLTLDGLISLWHPQ